MRKLKLCLLNLTLFLFLIMNSCTKSPVKSKSKSELTLIEKLQDIPGLQFKEISPVDGFKRSFEIYITQPVNHKDEHGEQFSQQIYLHHYDVNAPMVFYTSGYSANSNFIQELTPKLGANQLMVAHRYVADSRPNPTNWQYLTIEQAARDHHRIVEKFKDIYSGKWINVGHSKSGMTALFHRRFFPDDVEVTVAYVSPIIKGINDPRFDIFLNQIGSLECRNRIKTYQKLLLKNRTKILPLIQAYMDNSSLTYNVEPGIILEYEVCEYPFAHWQYYISGLCEAIPDSNSTIEELYQHLEDAGGFPIYSDEYKDYYAPLYYQAYTELGWYRLVNDHLNNLLISDPNPSYSFFTPINVPVNFNPQIMQDIENWLQTEGNDIIYIYGELDPWSAASIELTGQTNALKITQPGANHNVFIDQLDNPDLIYSTLESWLNLKIKRTVKIENKYTQTNLKSKRLLTN